MQAIARQPQRALDGTPVHYERRRPEQTALYRLVQLHAETYASGAWAALKGIVVQDWRGEGQGSMVDVGCRASGLPIRMSCRTWQSLLVQWVERRLADQDLGVTR